MIGSGQGCKPSIQLAVSHSPNLKMGYISPKLMGLKPRPFRAAFLVQFIDPVFPVYRDDGIIKT